MAALEMSPKSLPDMDLDASSGYSAAGTTTTISTASSPPAAKEHDLTLDPGPRIDLEFAEVFSENVAAKIWRVAVSHLEQDVSFNHFSFCFKQVAHIKKHVALFLKVPCLPIPRKLS